MTVKIGILGLGFMGHCHYRSYEKVPGAKVAAICDVDPKKRKGDWSSIAGNIGGGAGKEDLSGIATYEKAEALFKDPDIDIVDITLPTYLHAKYAARALKADKHVICEKPLAINSREAKKIVDAARKAKRHLFVAHCIRFWPAYAKAKEILDSKKYGPVRSATFSRLSATPTWSWQGWLMDSKKSGDAALDLHIHDADIVAYFFGKPKSVTASVSGFKPKRADHVVATYEYAKNQVITAEGGWDFAPGFGFAMTFRIVMEKATLVMTPDLSLTLHPLKGKSTTYKLPATDGYVEELKDFTRCVKTGKASGVVTPKSALNSVKLIEFERKSAQTGKPVKVTF